MEWLKQNFELSRGGKANNVRAMEGMRGFAVFLVFLVHYVTLIKPWIGAQSSVAWLSKALFTMGHTGVDLFFVLSGYLIYGSLISRPQNFFRFMRRRFERIYPAFIAVFVVYVALSFVFPKENKIPAPLSAGTIYLFENFLLLPGLFPIKPMITVTWSLSYEMFFYLMIPLVIIVLKLRGRSTLWRVTFFSTTAAVTAIYCAARGGHIRLIMFVSGILVYEAIHSSRVQAPSSLFALLFLLLGLLARFLPMEGHSGYTLKITVLFVSFFILSLTCFGNPSSWLSHAFSWTPLRWLGNMSYSYYLLHGLALKGVFLALPGVLPLTEHGLWFFGGLLPVFFALTLFPTAFLFLTVERPFSLAPRLAFTKGAKSRAALA